MKQRQFSQAQLEYIVARATFDVIRKAHNENSLAIDAECEKLGIETPWGNLPDETHPLMVKGQELLDAENAALANMNKAAHKLFDWATETTLAKMGTPEQKAQVRDMVTKVKRMCFVQKLWIELVDASMKLAA